MTVWEGLPLYDGKGKLMKKLDKDVQYRAIHRGHYIVILKNGESELVKPYTMSYERQHEKEKNFLQ